MLSPTVLDQSGTPGNGGRRCPSLQQAGLRATVFRTHLKFGVLQALFFASLFTFTLAGRGFAQQEPSDPGLLAVGETVWGFDGRVPLRNFVPLSIQLQNLGPTPWQGRLRLNRVVRGARTFGATLVQDVSLQGDETRWIQLTPYVIDDLEDWVLSWDEGTDYQVDLPPVIKGERPTVLVYDPDAVGIAGNVFKRMPESRFPTSVTATDTLRGIILDYVPFWQGAQARAFHDWLLSGGHVYVLKNSKGEFPNFPVALSFLNNERSQFRVGAGHVVKLERKADEFTLDEAKEQIFNDDLTKKAPTVDPPVNPGLATDPYALSYQGGSWNPNGEVFKLLRQLSKFNRHWWLIYSSVVGYLIVQFWACYGIGVEQKNVRNFYLVFLSTVVFFSVLFGLLGQVGDSSQNRIRSISLARSLDDGDFDVTGWAVLGNIFAGTHEVAYPGSGLAYSTTQETESVDGEMYPGSAGRVSFAMRPDSHRTVLHRARIRTNQTRPRIVENVSDVPRMKSLTIDITGCFPTKPVRAIGVLDGQVYSFKIDKQLLELDRRKVPEALKSYLEPPLDFGFNTWGMMARTRKKKPEERLQGLQEYTPAMRYLVGSSYQLSDVVDPRLLRRDKDELRLFVLAPVPDAFKLQSDGFPDAEEMIVFCYQLPL